MTLGLPTAIINGIDKLGGKKLAEELVKKDINVIGLGKESWWDEGMKGVEFRVSVEDVDVEVNYIFDLVGEEELLDRAEKDGAKITIVRINSEEVIDGRNGVDWRGVRLQGVLGEGMDSESGGVGWLVTALRQAVENKNLTIPGGRNKVRLLAVEDAVEAILRCTFLSGTSGEILEVRGNEVGIDDVAKILIDEAKMTRYKVIETGELEDDSSTSLGQEVEGVWSRLRWRPVVELKTGIRETLQYFFSMIDEENRNKLKKSNTKEKIVKTKQVYVPEKTDVEKEKKPRNWMVEVEVESADAEAMADKKEVIEDSEFTNKTEEREEDEDGWEVKPLLDKKSFEGVEFKNSNMRPVAGPLADKEFDEEETINEYEEEEEVEEEINSKSEILETKGENEKERGGSGIQPLRIKWKWVGAGGLATLVLFLGYFGGSMAVWWKQTMDLPKTVEARDYDKAIKQLVSLRTKIDERVKFMENSGLVRLGVGSKLTEGLKVWREGLEMGAAGVDLAKEGEVLNDGIFKDKDIDWNKELDKTGKNLEIMAEKSGVVEARLNGDWSWLPAGLRQRTSELKRQMEEVRTLAGAGKKLVEILPEIMGTDGKRKEYLVLFQNENELRPGGGFIGSYGILSFEGGKLLNLDIRDVYEADGQLKGHVEPPEAIKTYLGEAGWFMRDANWEASFPAAAKDVKWFLEKETGRGVDGVIGVNLAVAKSILEATGEVSVPDFKEKVNKDNLYEQAEFYSEKNFFAGSTQKETFLGSLGKQLFEEIKLLKPEKQWLLLKNMVDKFEENEIQMTVNDQKTEAVLSQLGWNGMIYGGKCGGERCFADYVYIVEANLGVNKANYFLYRNVEEAVEIQKNSISRVLKINYENTAKNTNWPGGNYKNYMRVYIPVTANLAEVSITDPKGGKTVYQGEALKVRNTGGKKEIGMLLEVPFASKRIVEIRYNDQINLEKGDSFSYLQYIQKQSGFGDTGWVTLVSYPSEWLVNQVEPEASVVSGKILFNQKLTRDIKMGVEIGR